MLARTGWLPRLRRWGNSPWVGWLGLALAWGLGCLALSVGTFGDEGERLVVAREMLHGARLYAEVFAQHFPFSFDCTWLIFQLLGPSVLAARWGILALHLVMAALVMRSTRWYLPVALMTVLWRWWAPLYFGQMMLYQTLDGLLVWAVLMLTLKQVLDQPPATRGRSLALGIVGGLAVANDPGMIFPVLWASGVYLVVTPWRTRRWWVVAFGSVGGVYLARLGLTGSLASFYRETIWFNQNIYSRYVGSENMRLGIILQALGNGLQTLQGFQPWNPLNYGWLSHFPAEWRWLGDGLWQRWVMFSASLALLWRRWPAALFVYGFAATLLFRDDVFFRAQPVMLCALALATLAVCGILLRGTTVVWHGAWRAWLGAGLALLASATLAWGWNDWRNQRNFAMTFAQELESVSTAQQLACHTPEVRFGYYPGNPMVNFLAGWRLLGGYSYFLPWHAATEREALLHALASEPLVLIYWDRTALVWSQWALAEAAPDVGAYLDAHYVALGNNYFASPQLAAQCAKP